MSITRILKELMEKLDLISSENIIADYTPILYFGDIDISQIATIGLNPSDKEYLYDNKAKTYRFYSKANFGINKWEELNENQLEKIKKTYDLYFKNNPYKRWFDKLDRLIFESGFSYYFPYYNAVHFDIIPVATQLKWGEVNNLDKNLIINEYGIFLTYLLEFSKVKVCILNGQGVVDYFQNICLVALKKEWQPTWDISTKNKIVKGYSYQSDYILKSGKKILVLGYNHNIQSSYGVSNNIVTEIKNWIKAELDKNEKFIYEYRE